MAPIEYRAAAVEYVAAMKSVRCAKNVFFLLLVLGILTELTGFAVMSFTGKLDAAYGHADSPPATAPAAISHARRVRMAAASAVTSTRA